MGTSLPHIRAAQAAQRVPHLLDISGYQTTRSHKDALGLMKEGSLLSS